MPVHSSGTPTLIDNTQLFESAQVKNVQRIVNADVIAQKLQAFQAVIAQLRRLRHRESAQRSKTSLGAGHRVNECYRLIATIILESLGNIAVKYCYETSLHSVSQLAKHTHNAH
ncbi:MAG: hypothetical protein ACLPLR_19255 [Terriglobales bacterium]